MSERQPAAPPPRAPGGHDHARHANSQGTPPHMLCWVSALLQCRLFSGAVPAGPTRLALPGSCSYRRPAPPRPAAPARRCCHHARGTACSQVKRETSPRPKWPYTAVRWYRWLLPLLRSRFAMIMPGLQAGRCGAGLGWVKCGVPPGGRGCCGRQGNVAACTAGPAQCPMPPCTPPPLRCRAQTADPTSRLKSNARSNSCWMSMSVAPCCPVPYVSTVTLSGWASPMPYATCTPQEGGGGGGGARREEGGQGVEAHVRTY